MITRTFCRSLKQRYVFGLHRKLRLPRRSDDTKFSVFINRQKVYGVGCHEDAVGISMANADVIHDSFNATLFIYCDEERHIVLNEPRAYNIVILFLEFDAAN